VNNSGAAKSQDLTFSLKTMNVTPRAQRVRATTKGTISIPFYCGGNVLPACKGRAVLRLGNVVSGSARFSVRRAHKKRVVVWLNKGIIRRLLAGRGVKLVLSLSVQTGTGVAATTAPAPITVLPPRK